MNTHARPAGAAGNDVAGEVGPWSARPLSIAGWTAGLLAVGAFVVAILRQWQLTVVDRDQQLHLLETVGGGHIYGALAEGGQTSGPGYAVLAPVYVLARHWDDPHLAFATAGLACLVPLAAATIWALRSVGVPRRSPLELLALAAVVGGVPVLSCYTEALHPADVLALACVLAAYAAALRGRVGWSAVLLGFGLATRQWVLVAVAVIAVLERGRARLVIIGGSIGAFAVVVGPFLLADRSGSMSALAARLTIKRAVALPGTLPLSGAPLYLISRYLPLALAYVVCRWLIERRGALTPEVAAAALAVVCSLRALVDPASFLYYLAPGYAFLVVLEARHWRRVVALGVGGIAFLVPKYHFQESYMRFIEEGTRTSLSYVVARISYARATLGTVLFLAPVVWGIVRLERLTRRRPDGVGVPEPGGSATPAEGHG